MAYGASSSSLITGVVGDLDSWDRTPRRVRVPLWWWWESKHRFELRPQTPPPNRRVFCLPYDIRATRKHRHVRTQLSGTP